MRKIPFCKMQGDANDYIYINCFGEEIDDPEALSVQMSRRHFSVGSDGLVLICPSPVADAKMRMFNADGSEGKMCGNAIRCVAKYLYDEGIVKKKEMKIETLSGIKSLALSQTEPVTYVSVDMGRASFDPADIPIAAEKEHIEKEIEVNGKTYVSTAVSMGNPHNVIFLDENASLDLEKTGPGFECHPLFPERTNTEFAVMISDKEIDMRVWERGSGETYACGTGACATAAAAVKTGRSKAGERIKVKLKGGDLFITVKEDYSVIMEGPAVRVYDGVYYDEY